MRKEMYREKSWQTLWEEENLFFPRRKPSGRERERNLTYSFLAGSFMSCFSDNTGGFVRW